MAQISNKDTNTNIKRINYIPINVFLLANQSCFLTNENTPLCNLIVLNKPLIYYTLEFFERQYISDIYILTTPEFSFSISDVLKRYKGEIKPHVVSVNKHSFEGLNIFEVVNKKLNKSNFIILKPNTLFDFNLYSLIDFHLINNNLITLCLNDKKSNKDQSIKLEYCPSNYNILANYNNSNNNIHQIFGTKKDIDMIKDINYNLCLKKLVYACNINNNNNKKNNNLSIDKIIMHKHLNINLECNYDDVELYIFNKSIFSLLEINKIKNFSDIKYQLLSFLINKSNHRIIINKMKQYKLKNDSNSLNNNVKSFHESESCSDKTNNNVIDVNKENEHSDYCLKIFGCIVDNCYTIDSSYSYLNILNEVNNSNIENISKFYFKTENNYNDIFQKHKETIYNNLLNKKDYYTNLDNIFKNISLSNIISSDFNNDNKECSNIYIDSSSIGLNCNCFDNSKIQDSIIFNNCQIGKK